jgi:hypothetical protein
LAIPLSQIANILDIALVSSIVLSIIAMALTLKILILTDVSRPWKLAGSGFIVSMFATLALVYLLFGAGSGITSFVFFYLLYMTTGFLIYTSLRQLEMASDDPSGAVLG